MTEGKKETKALVPNGYYAPVTEPFKAIPSYFKKGLAPLRYLKACFQDAKDEPEHALANLFGRKRVSGIMLMASSILGLAAGGVGAIGYLELSGTAAFTAFQEYLIVWGSMFGGALAGPFIGYPAVILGGALLGGPLMAAGGFVLGFIPKMISGSFKALNYHESQKQLRKTKVVLATSAAPQLEAPKGFKKITGMFKKKSAPVVAKEIPEPMGTIEHKPIPAVKKPKGGFPL